MTEVGVGDPCATNSEGDVNRDINTGGAYHHLKQIPEL